MRFIHKIFLLLLLLVPVRLFPQASISDSAISLHLLTASYTFYLPGADMAQRYGQINKIGFSYGYKFKSNFMLSATYSSHFGMSVRDSNMFRYIETDNGYLIDPQGLMAGLGREMRGFAFELKMSKIFPVIGPNENSGIFVSMGTGILQHRILFRSYNGYIPQIDKSTYAKGYDRLSNGAMLIENIGFLRLSNKNLGNWSVSFEAVQGFTKSRRSWDFELMKYDDTKRLDLLWGINLNWNFPIYRRTPPEFYFY